MPTISFLIIKCNPFCLLSKKFTSFIVLKHGIILTKENYSFWTNPFILHRLLLAQNFEKTVSKEPASTTHDARKKMEQFTVPWGRKQQMIIAHLPARCGTLSKFFQEVKASVFSQKTISEKSSRKTFGSLPLFLWTPRIPTGLQPDHSPIKN